MQTLDREIDELAESTHFSGVVRIDRAETAGFAKAYGYADRRHEILNAVDTQFGVASVAKGFTALVVMRLVEDGLLDLDTTARSLLGSDLPMIGDDVTIQHLLSHRSGIGDYLDEDELDDISAYAMPIGVHQLAQPEDYLAVLDGFPTVREPDQEFSYNNGAFVVLAILAERAAGRSYYELVRHHICEPAGLADTEFLRSDELPGRAAMGYLEPDQPRTNILHLPVRGCGDGGIYTTAADLSALWTAFFDGRIVTPENVQRMVHPLSHPVEEERRYGLGFWLHETSTAAMLVGYDAGVSAHTVHDPETSTTHTVISNSSEGAWPLATLLLARLTP